MRISDPACNDNEPPCYLEPDLEHPLFMEAIDQALALCSEEGGPPHVKLVLEWTPESKSAVIADDTDIVEEHSSVKLLRTQALQGGAPLTLEECLRHYTKAETLTMDDAWRCPHCQQYLPVVKTLDIWSLPDILVVHFKRFRQQTIKGRNSTKLTTMVDFPVYSFDMTPHLANKHNTNMNHSNMPEMGNGWSPWKRSRKQSNSNDNTYDLYAVCYHHGTDLETGHYTAACKNPYDNQWYLYDDAKVTNLSQQSDDVTAELVNSSAYILFYQRRSVGSSSSSAASTSSVGSGGDHWVCRMPKFVVPKNMKKPVNEATETEPKKETENVRIAEPVKQEDAVTLRNSQNALYNSTNSLRKSQEHKSTNTVAMDNVSDSPTTVKVNTTEVPRKPLYTTSIYINSSGNVDISTLTCKEKSPVLSAHRVNGLSEQDVNDRLDGTAKEDRMYRTTAAVHRYSDLDRREKKYHSDSGVIVNHLNWMSPQADRRINQSQSSM